MKGRPVDELVHEYMFPKPRQNDPPTFHALLQRSLILEVRQEVHAFYGHLDTQEAKYPGLDYCHPTHRIRLSRWPWHRRLFRAFDGLRLTPAEIGGLTKWEGTKWAKERFEREQGITIRDTTADGFPDWVEPADRPVTAVTVGREASAELEEPACADAADEDMDAEEEEEEDEEDGSEDEMVSVGVELNERLRERAALREAGDTSAVLDEAWEQWLKNAIENGELGLRVDSILHVDEDPLNTGIPFPEGVLSAARAGRWSEIPDFLHDVIRRAIASQPQQEVQESLPQGRSAADDEYNQDSEQSSTRSSTPLSRNRSIRSLVDGQRSSRLFRHPILDLDFAPSNVRTVPLSNH